MTGEPVSAMDETGLRHWLERSAILHFHIRDLTGLINLMDKRFTGSRSWSVNDSFLTENLIAPTSRCGQFC
jgi:hypothetical protein